jgi:hypothetical protein
VEQGLEQGILYKNFSQAFETKQYFTGVMTSFKDVIRLFIHKNNIMKYLILMAMVIGFSVSCNNPDQNSAAGNSADVRDTSNRTNPNSNVADTGHIHVEGDTSHRH